MTSAVLTRRLRHAGAVVLMSTLTLGCATNAGNGAMAGGAVACALAVAMAGPGNKGAACAKGAAVGAAAGYWLGLQKDAQDAKLAMQSLKNRAGPDVDVVVRTRAVALPKDAQSGVLANVQTIEVLQDFVYSVPTSRIVNGDAEIVAGLRGVGGTVSTFSQPSTVQITSRTQQDFIRAVNLIQSGYTTPIRPEKVKYGYVEDSRSRLTTVKVVQQS